MKSWGASWSNKQFSEKYIELNLEKKKNKWSVLNYQNKM